MDCVKKLEAAKGKRHYDQPVRSVSQSDHDETVIEQIFFGDEVFVRTPPGKWREMTNNMTGFGPEMIKIGSSELVTCTREPGPDADGRPTETVHLRVTGSDHFIVLERSAIFDASNGDPLSSDATLYAGDSDGKELSKPVHYTWKWTYRDVKLPDPGSLSQ